MFGVAKGNYALVQLSQWLDERGTGARFGLSRFPTGHYFLRIAAVQPASALLAVRRKSWLLVAGTEQRTEELTLSTPLDAPPEATGSALVTGMLDAAAGCQRWASDVGLSLAAAAFFAAADLNLRPQIERALVEFLAPSQYGGHPGEVVAEARAVLEKFAGQPETPWTVGVRELAGRPGRSAPEGEPHAAEHKNELAAPAAEAVASTEPWDLDQGELADGRNGRRLVAQLLGDEFLLPLAEAFPGEAVDLTGRLLAGANDLTHAELEDLSKSEDSRVRVNVAKNPLTPRWLWATMVSDPYPGVRGAISGRTDVSPSLLAFLAGDPHRAPRVGVAGNPRTPPQTLLSLATDPDEFVRGCVARNLASEAKTLEVLALDPAAEIRQSIASRADLSERLVLLLARDVEPEVRKVVAGRLDLPGSLARELMRDAAPAVRSSLARNDTVPDEVYQVLLTDDSPSVRAALGHNERLSPSQRGVLAGDAEGSVRGAVLGVEGVAVPPQALTALARDPDPWIRSRVAHRFDSPADALVILSEDSEAYIRAAAAGNPGLPVTRAAALMRDEASLVRDAVVRREDAPVELLAALLTSASKAGSGGMDVLSAAMSPKLDVAFLTALSTSPNEVVRYGVAANPNTPREVLEVLARDDEVALVIDDQEERVSDAARHQLNGADEETDDDWGPF